MKLVIFFLLFFTLVDNSSGQTCALFFMVKDAATGKALGNVSVFENRSVIAKSVPAGWIRLVKIKCITTVLKFQKEGYQPLTNYSIEPDPNQSKVITIILNDLSTERYYVFELLKKDTIDLARFNEKVAVVRDSYLENGENRKLKAFSKVLKRKVTLLQSALDSITFLALQGTIDKINPVTKPPAYYHKERRDYYAQNGPIIVGGAEMHPKEDIVENAIKSKVHTTLVSALKSADLVETLKRAGNITVFAPTNEAFRRLPSGTVNNLIKPEWKTQLIKILSNHIVPGIYNTKKLMELIKQGGGMAELTTKSGGHLDFRMKGGKIYITDEHGTIAQITIGNIIESNGIMHVIDNVLL